MAALKEIKYSIRMRKATEDMITKLTVFGMKQFILANSEVEEDEDEKSYILPEGESKGIFGKTYEMTTEENNGDEFIITEDGRLFFVVSVSKYVEIIDTDLVSEEEVDEMVETIENAMAEENVMFEKMEETLENKIKTSMALNLEFNLDGYTKSLITNFQNMFPMNTSEFTKEEIEAATKSNLIRKVNWKGNDRYQNEKIKLTEKGKKHFLKHIAR